MFEYRKATAEDLERIWDRSIAENAEDPRWVRWKKEYIAYNQNGMAATFVVICNGQPVGEGTLLFSGACSAIRERDELADHIHTANVNALRIRKEYEGQGHISALMRLMEDYAAKKGYTRLTIGVEARETRNLGIYLHWGYDAFVMSESEDGELVLYYAKKLKNITAKEGKLPPKSEKVEKRKNSGKKKYQKTLDKSELMCYNIKVV